MSPPGYFPATAAHTLATGTLVTGARVKGDFSLLALLKTSFLIQLFCSFPASRVEDLIKCVNFDLWRRAACVYSCWAAARYQQQSAAAAFPSNEQSR